MLAPYKQEVACSSQAPPIAANPLPERIAAIAANGGYLANGACGSVVEATGATLGVDGGFRA